MMRLAGLLVLVLAPLTHGQDQAHTVLIHTRLKGVVGTGTIIEAAGGRALVLACEHQFYSPTEPIGQIGVSRMGDPTIYRATRLGDSDEPGTDLTALVIPDPGGITPLEIATEQPKRVSYAGFGLDRTICWIRTGQLAKTPWDDWQATYRGLHVVPGDSGSGLYDERGRLAGIVAFYIPETGDGTSCTLPMLRRFLKSPQVMNWRNR